MSNTQNTPGFTPDSFNFRNPSEGEITDIQRKVQQRRLAKAKYKVLSQLLAGKKEVDVTISPEIFEALNRERMEFEEILKLHPEQANDAILAAKEDREKFSKDKYWNPQSEARWGVLGHIPPCIFYSRPMEYWKDKKLLREFYNGFPKFRVSIKRI